MNRPIGSSDATGATVARKGGSTGAGPVVIVANPTAGGFSRGKLDRLAAQLQQAGSPVRMELTTRAGHLIDIATHLEESATTLVVGGGDGSLNEAVTGLLRRAELRPDLAVPALAVLPFGTANVLAHELALPFRADALASAIAKGRTRPLHLGAIGTRPFLLMVSAGFDGDVVHAVDPAAKRRWGKLAYAAAALRLAVARTGRDVIVEADGERLVSRLAVVTTARCYGGPLTITRNTDVTRPGLRLVSLSDDRPWTLARAAVALALGRLDRMAKITDRPVETVRFHGADIRMQIDGDRMDASEGTVRAGSRVLQVIVG